MTAYKGIANGGSTKGYAVGWVHKGHPAPEEKIAALNEMLDRHGNDTTDWLIPPTIHYHHVDTVVLRDFHSRTFAPMDNCYWSVRGVLVDKPEHGLIPEGVRMPLYGDREYDR
jgi:hypothetical protein